MHRPSLAHLALFAVLLLGTACGGAQSHTESPSVTPLSGSDPSSGGDGSASKTDTQLPESALGKGDVQKGKSTSEPSAGKPESSSAAEDAIISGNALPPSPNAASAPRASRPTKVKKPGKAPKKSAQASRG